MTPAQLLEDGWIVISWNVGVHPFTSLHEAYLFARDLATEKKHAVRIEATFAKGGCLCRKIIDRALPETEVPYVPLGLVLKPITVKPNVVKI